MMVRTKIIAVVVFTILVCTRAQVNAKTLHVDPCDPAAFQSVQGAIDAAKKSDTVVVHPGVYKENIDFKARAITVRSIDPNDSKIVASTIIDGNEAAAAVVSFQMGETPDSILRGFTIRNGRDGVMCRQVDARPRITQCVIISNRVLGVCGGKPIITDCLITQNRMNAIYSCGGDIRDCLIVANGDGICFSRYGGAPTLIRNCVIAGHEGNGVLAIGDNGATAEVLNCTIVGNRQNGVDVWRGGILTVSNSIVAYNLGAGVRGAKLHHTQTYGNAYDERGRGMNPTKPPLFVDIGYWDEQGTWHQGDYHLMSTAGRWDPATQTWVKDSVDSACIDAGDPNTPVGDEPYPNGGRINLGAYGGTAEASMSYGLGQILARLPK